MKYIGLLFLLVGAPAMGADKIIQCSNSTCSANFAPQSQLEKPNYSAIEVGANQDNIVVSVPANSAPRSVRLSVQNGAFPGKNLNVNLSSTRASDNAGSVVIIGDTFNNLVVQSNGYNGSRGKDASELCAERFRAGQYGVDSKSFFEQRRQADPSLTLTRCDRLDLNYLQTYKFQCDDASFQQFAVENPQVEVNRLRARAQCSGVSVQDACIKKRATVQCQWRHFAWVGCGKGCTTKQYQSAWSYSTRREDEVIINSEINSRGWAGYCTNVVGKPGCPAGQCDLETYTTYYQNVYSFWGGTCVRNYGLDVDAGVTINNQCSLGPTYENLFRGYYNDWDLRLSYSFTPCSGSYTFVKSVYKQKITYDPTGTDCSKNDVGVPEDPFKKISWVYTGMVQDAAFGREQLICAPSNCPVSSTVSEFNRSLEEIYPESGSNGTQQGYGLAFVYDVQNVSVAAQPGAAGAGGKNDIPVLTSMRYCVKVSDAISDGDSSAYAKTPFVAFRKYNWTALKSGAGGNAGTPPVASDNAVKVYRKMDDSVRFLLTKELL